MFTMPCGCVIEYTVGLDWEPGGDGPVDIAILESAEMDKPCSEHGGSV